MVKYTELQDNIEPWYIIQPRPRYAGPTRRRGGTGERRSPSHPANCTRTHKLAFLSSRRMRRRRRRRRRQTSARPLAACAPRRSVAANARRTCPSNARWSPHRINHAREIPRRVRDKTSSSVLFRKHNIINIISITKSL